MKSILVFLRLVLWGIPNLVFQISKLKEKIVFVFCWLFITVLLKLASIGLGQFLSTIISLSGSYCLMVFIFLGYCFFQFVYITQEEI